jgi:hypothetical protein
MKYVHWRHPELKPKLRWSTRPDGYIQYEGHNACPDDIDDTESYPRTCYQVIIK